MDSWAIMEWLDEAYPDRPSIFLPSEPAPVDRASEAYKRAVKKEDEAWKKFAGILVPVYDDVFGLCEYHCRGGESSNISRKALTRLPLRHLPPLRTRRQRRSRAGSRADV